MIEPKIRIVETTEWEFVPSKILTFATMTTPKYAKLPSSQISPPCTSKGIIAMMNISAEDINAYKIQAQNFQV